MIAVWLVPSGDMGGRRAVLDTWREQGHMQGRTVGRRYTEGDTGRVMRRWEQGEQRDQVVQSCSLSRQINSSIAGVTHLFLW